MLLFAVVKTAPSPFNSKTFFRGSLFANALWSLGKVAAKKRFEACGEGVALVRASVRQKEKPTRFRLNGGVKCNQSSVRPGFRARRLYLKPAHLAAQAPLEVLGRVCRWILPAAETLNWTQFTKSISSGVEPRLSLQSVKWLHYRKGEASYSLFLALSCWSNL